jgi:hypothetical protein
MTDVRDDLVPTDGLCDYFVEVDCMTVRRGGGDLDIRFRIIKGVDDPTATAATITFPVQAQDDGIEGMIARGFDELILVLRQVLYQADKQRTYYRTKARPSVSGH